MGRFGQSDQTMNIWNLCATIYKLAASISGKQDVGNSYVPNPLGCRTRAVRDATTGRIV